MLTRPHSISSFLIYSVCVFSERSITGSCFYLKRQQQINATFEITVNLVIDQWKEEDHFLVSQVEDNELPALELIEDVEASCHIQVWSGINGEIQWNLSYGGLELWVTWSRFSSVINSVKGDKNLCFYPVQMKDSSLSSTLSDSTVTFGKSDGASTSNTDTTYHSSPTSSPLANPDLIQTEANPVCTSALKVRTPQFCLALKFWLLEKNIVVMDWQILLCSQTMSTTSTASTITSTFCSPTSENEQRQLMVASPSLVRPPFVLGSPSPHTPDFGQRTYTAVHSLHACVHADSFFHEHAHSFVK